MTNERTISDTYNYKGKRREEEGIGGIYLLILYFSICSLLEGLHMGLLQYKNVLPLVCKIPGKILLLGTGPAKLKIWTRRLS